MMRRLNRALGLALCVAGVATSLLAGEPEQKKVTLASQPSGATVIVDGQDRGTTPVTLFDLAPGRHHVKYRLAGYVERDRFFNTNEETGTTVEKCQVLDEEKGLLLLKTEPEGCDIQIDGVSVGRTPRLITNLATKDAYTVRLRKPGYQDQTISVKFDGRKPLVREEKMVLASGTINVISEPEGAEVTVNGIVRGKAPITVTDVPKGRAVVKFRIDGFEDEVRELAIKAGDMQTLSVVLQGFPGTLHLISVPDGARFYVNGEARGKGPLSIPGLKPGDYEVKAELEGYGTVTRTVAIANGQAAREEFRLSNQMGRLEIRTSPVGAHVLLDGRPVGVSKAQDATAEFSDVLSLGDILEGEHTLTLRKDGYAEVIRHPKVTNGKTTQQSIRMKRIFVPDVEIVTARGSYQGVLVSKTAELVTIEVKLGITQSFLRSEIRQMNFLKTEK